MTRDWIRPGRARLLAALLLIGVFAAGTLTGAAADRLLEARESEPFALDRRPRGPRVVGRPDGRGPVRISPAMMLQRRLELTEGQTIEIEGIFEARRRRTEAILGEIEPRLVAQRDSTDREIRAVLIGGQIEAFDSLIAQRPQVFFRAFRGPPPERLRGP